MKAQQILEAGIGHMKDRASTYDKPDGERSMGATVNAFYAITGQALTEEQGWLFMAILKAVRSQQGAFRADSYEDGAAYFALMGEAAHQERLIDPQERDGWNPESIAAVTFKRAQVPPFRNPPPAGWPNELRHQGEAEDVTIWPPDDSPRQQRIEQSGELAEAVYPALDAIVPPCGWCGAFPDQQHESGCAGGARE
ncbi:hypothetical protein OF001_U170027 [Pseudomonas sp. OF001]|uniref:DUF6378 domain-containing protein n=1 Tax=Pseudomonas sp. OF001 TaxID=2772300 RepID=UPI0019B761EA|nr:DUF6378 domain-containing protein [Pseudomonas sp. OF001]CAD5376730.1 hypothetical protein OF001_U170027 [Pseudomonas sp. OF001]